MWRDPDGDDATMLNHRGEKAQWTNACAMLATSSPEHASEEDPERWPPRIVLTHRPAPQVNLFFCHLRFLAFKADCGCGGIVSGKWQARGSRPSVSIAV